MQFTENDEQIREVCVEMEHISLPGYLRLPEKPQGLVVFAHGSGSGRDSPRNQYVAGRLSEGELATLLLDLLTEKEEARDIASGELRFDIDFLAGRLAGAIQWLRTVPATHGLPIGLFGASTGAAAALTAAAAAPDVVRAVVSRGGRPDLAESSLPRVQAPVLLIVGQRDEAVLEANARACEQVCPDGEKEMQIISGAGHLFEEPGALETVAQMATDWFRKHLAA